MCTLLCLGMTAQAQGVKFGVLAGMNTNTAQFRGTKIGFDFGVKSEIGIPSVSKGLYLGTALQLSLLKEGEAADYYSSKTENKPYFLNLPVHIGYKFNVGDNMNLFVNAGPYIGIGLWGNQKQRLSNAEDKKVEMSSGDVFKNEITKRFDWGAGFNAGIEFARHYQLSAGYDWGFENLKGSKSILDNKHRIFKITASYMF